MFKITLVRPINRAVLISILFIFNTFHSIAQFNSIDRIKLEKDLNGLWHLGKNTSDKSQKVISSSNKSNITFFPEYKNDVFDRKEYMVLLEFDSTYKIKNGRRYQLESNRYLWGWDIMSITKNRNSYYFVSDYKRNGILGKFDNDLNISWIKELSISSDLIVPSNILIENDTIFVLGNSDSLSYIFKFDSTGNSLENLKLFDSSVGSSRVLNASKELVPYKSNLLLISQLKTAFGNNMGNSSDSIILISILDKQLNLLDNHILLKQNDQYQPDFQDAFIFQEQLVLELGDGGNIQFITFDSSLNIVQTKNFIRSANLGIIDPLGDSKTIINKNEITKIIPFSGLSQINSDSYILTFDSLLDLKTSYLYDIQSNSASNLRKSKLLGMESKMSGNTFFRIEDNDNSNGENCSDCYYDLLKTPISLESYNCENIVENVFSSTTISNFSLSQHSISNELINIFVGNIPVSNLGLSANEYRYCGTLLDTCGSLKANVKTYSGNTVCQGDLVDFYSFTYMADQYMWTVNGTLIDSLNSTSYKFDSIGNYNVKLRIYPPNNLNCFTEDSFMVRVGSPPELNLTDTIICVGDTIQIQASGASTYQWNFSNQLSCLNCPNPFVSSEDSTQFILTGTDSLGCSSTDTFNLNVYPKPNASISGSNTVCPGINDVWFGLNPLDSFIASWWIDTVGIITQDFGDSIYTTWPQGIDSAFVYAYVQYPAGCEGDTIRFKVKVNRALEPSIIVNDDSICFNERENVTYNLSYNTNGSIYLWEIKNGQILSGDSTASIQVNWDSVGTGKLIVREYSTTSIDTCYGEDSVLIEILPNPENDLQLLGKENVCLDEDVNYEISSGWINSSYEWVAIGSSNLTGQGTERIQTSWNSTGDYLVSVEEISEYGCKGPKDSLEVTVHPIPEPQRVGDDTLLCLDELGNQNYEVSGFVNSAFNWSIEGGIIKGGQGTNSLNVTWDSTIIKSLTVQEISEFGCESETLDIKQYFDLSRLELFVVSVTEDSSISLDFELESLRSYPGDSIYIARRSEIPDASNWVRINRIPKTSTEFNDQSINPNENSFGYRVEGKNTCEQEIKSRDHASLLLTGKRTYDVPSEVSVKELVQLNWTAYRNWDGGVKTYELYEKFDSLYVKVAEANQTELIYDPKIPKKEHCFRIRSVQNGEIRESWSNAFCIELERALNIPNVVTPNGDNKNDRLQIENLAAYPEHELIIYNRWGQETFKTNAYNNNWPEDNTISGTYFYRLRIKDETSGMEENYKGWVQVLR